MEPYLPSWLNHTNQHAFLLSHPEVPVYATLIYVFGLVTLPWIMKDRAPFTLKWPSALWNFSIALFSIVACAHVMPGLIKDYLLGGRQGISHELCTLDEKELNPWLYMFIFSKIPEFIDTLLLILKKKPLIFLHWYHHITTMWFCWVATGSQLTNGALFTGMNLFVHSIMYTYYLCSTLKIFWPQWARVSITVLQILQMFFGMAAIIHNLMHCPGGHENIYYAGLAMYTSFCILFIDFFIKDNCKKKSPAATPKKSD